MYNLDIKLNEINVKEENGSLYRKDEWGNWQKAEWNSLLEDFENTELYRAQNIVALNKQKVFNNIGINTDAILSKFLNPGSDQKLLIQLVLEELERLQVDIISLNITVDKWTSKLNITIAK